MLEKEIKEFKSLDWYLHRPTRFYLSMEFCKVRFKEKLP